jgi:hypothetical protein
MKLDKLVAVKFSCKRKTCPGADDSPARLLQRTTKMLITQDGSQIEKGPSFSILAKLMKSESAHLASSAMAVRVAKHLLRRSTG